LKIRQKSFLLFGRANLSAKLEKAPRIDNFLGFPGISGADLGARFQGHLHAMDIPLQSEQVSGIFSMGDYFALATGKNTYEATAVIIAGGVVTGGPFPGEERLLGRGVGYCATCDAPLYRNKVVAIVGSGQEAAMEAEFVAEIARKVYYIPLGAPAAPPAAPVEVIEAKVLEIKGQDQVDSLVLSDRTLELNGVFILRDSLSPDALIPGIKIENGHILVDQGMRTSIPGCFAAGDCTGKPYQFMRAAGQGQTAALNAVQYIDAKKAEK